MESYFYMQYKRYYLIDCFNAYDMPHIITYQIDINIISYRYFG